MLLKACINGARRFDAHPALPVTPVMLGWAAASAVHAGAAAVHFHVRGMDKEQSLAPDDVARSVDAVRRAIDKVPLGVSTLLSIVPDPDARVAVASKWTVVPDFASVNFIEKGSPALAKVLIDKGVGIEAGLSDASAASTLVASGLGQQCLRILIEPRGATVEAALKSADDMIAVLDKAGITRPRLLHGSNATAWGVLDEAIRRGLDTRCGLEDMLVLPDGSAAADNAAIVAAARRKVEQSGRQV